MDYKIIFGVIAFSLAIMGVNATHSAYAATYNNQNFSINYPDHWEFKETKDVNYGGLQQWVIFADHLPEYTAKVIVLSESDVLAGYQLDYFDYLQFSIDFEKD